MRHSSPMPVVLAPTGCSPCHGLRWSGQPRKYCSQQRRLQQTDMQTCRPNWSSRSGLPVDDSKLPLHPGGFRILRIPSDPTTTQIKAYQILVSPLETRHFCLVQESIVCTDRVVEVSVEELPKSFLGPSFFPIVMCRAVRAPASPTTSSIHPSIHPCQKLCPC
jgi:hypothetical protein